MTDDLIQILSWAAIGVALLVAIVAFWFFRDKFSRMQENQRISDASFEAQMLALARSAPRAEISNDRQTIPSIGGNYRAADALTSEEIAPRINSVGAADVTSSASYMRDFTAQAPAAAMDELQTVRDPYMEPADRSCAKIVSQLTHGGLLESEDGYADLHGNPKGALIVKLRGGKRCLIVPHFESEPYLMRNLKRYDMIICVGKDGKAVVLTRLEEMIASRLGGAMR
jgi:hypothetical protein